VIWCLPSVCAYAYKNRNNISRFLIGSMWAGVIYSANYLICIRCIRVFFFLLINSYTFDPFFYGLLFFMCDIHFWILCLSTAPSKSQILIFIPTVLQMNLASRLSKLAYSAIRAWGCLPLKAADQFSPIWSTSMRSRLNSYLGLPSFF
jgi:hypothetical protein